MSQLDDTILDALTHVTFPKGFAQAEPAWVVTVDGVDYPLWQTDALVVGSGAAGLRAAVELKRRQQNVLIATAGLYMGTSACSGSDKQTLFTAATAGNGDNWGRGYNIDYWPVYPAAYTGDNSITVANLMFNGSLDESSNFGTFSVDIAAPGTYILSTTPGGYGFMSGTSMAAPMVTAAAAMVYSARPETDLLTVKNILIYSAHKLAPLKGLMLSSGMLDVSAAMTWGLANP